jgi:hypothetical protein
MTVREPPVSTTTRLAKHPPFQVVQEEKEKRKGKKSVANIEREMRSDGKGN